jgi:dolichyl-phosphate beta-glucosyltransferase
MTATRWPASPWLEIIVPARNEQLRLPAGLAALCAKTATLAPGVAITVVDSASTDATAEIVSQWPAGPVPVRLLDCARPGKGAAVRAGLLATTGAYVGFCDADMAADLSALDVAVDLLMSGCPVVLGSRAHPESIVDDRHSILRKKGAAVFRGVARTVVPGVRDTQCGFKFFAGPVARAAAADMRATGFAFDIELIARCRQIGAQPTEIPVRWQDVPGSTFSVWRHSVAAFAEVAGIWLALRTPTAHPRMYPVDGSVPAAGAGGSADIGGAISAWTESA